MTSTTGTLLHGPRHVICTLRLLVLVGLVMLGTRQSVADPILYWVLVSVYGLTILGYLWTRDTVFEHAGVKVAIFLFDLLMVSGLIILRGQDVSGFLAAYYGLVLMAAIVEGIGTAGLNAIFVSILYAALTRWGTPLPHLLDFAVVSQFVFFFLIALLMGHMADRTRHEARDRHHAERACESVTTELRQSTEALKAAREALRASDRLATLGMLSAGIAHEIRNPLSAIANNLGPAAEYFEEFEAALRRGEDGAEAKTELQAILEDCRTACDHLGHVARNLGAMARKPGGAPAPVAPGELIDTALRLLRVRMAGQVQVSTHIATRRNLLADGGQVMQVVLNLAANAIDAMEGRPGARLSIEAVDAGPDRIALIVADTGAGIPPEIRDRIFEPFFTTKGPGRGTGLGLHVVSEIMTAHRGSIRCECPTGGGTTFRVEFPADVLPGPEEADHGGCETPDGAADRGRRGLDPSGAGAHAPAGALRAPARV